MSSDGNRVTVRQPGDGGSVSLGPNQVTFLVAGEQTEGRYSLTEFAAAPPPAPAAPLHIHHDADEAIYILEGQFQVTMDGQQIGVSAGAFVFVPRDTPHTIANVGADVGRLLVLLTPPGFEGYWREMSPLLQRSDGPPDGAVVLALQHKYHMDTAGQARQFTTEPG